MQSNLWSFVAKFLDNAHLGKAATDLTPGFIFAIALLLLVGNSKNLEVFPYFHLDKYEERIKDAQREFNEARKNHLDKQKEIAELKLEKKSDTTKKRLAELGVKEKQLKQEHDEAKKIIATVKGEEKDAATLSANMQIVTDNFLFFLFSGLFLGILFAQVSGAVFYNGIFYLRFKHRFPKLHTALYPAQDGRTDTYYRIRIKKEFQKKIPDLEIRYHRYLEVAMNMILPVLILTATVFIIAYSYSQPSLVLIILGVLGLLATVGLIRNAWLAYIGYFIRKADVVNCLKNLPEEDALKGGATEKNKDYNYTQKNLHRENPNKIESRHK